MLDRLLIALAVALIGSMLLWVGMVVGKLLSQYVSWQIPAISFVVIFVLALIYDWWTERRKP